MKKLILKKLSACFPKGMAFIITAIIISASASAQTLLPYYTGFDDSTQTAGWQEFRLGVSGNIFGWGYISFGGEPSPPAALYHPNNSQAASTDTTIDWWVSPQFDFSGGAKIDSMYALSNNWFGPLPGDFIGLYLLTGSPDPSLATTETLLVDFTLFPNGPGGGYSDTTNILIPPTAGASYIAFKFTGTNSLFQAEFDNIYISALPTGIEDANADADINIYPNPATNHITIALPNNSKKVEVTITDITGKIIYSTTETDKEKLEVNTQDFAAGIYVVQIQSADFIVTKKLVIEN